MVKKGYDWKTVGFASAGLLAIGGIGYLFFGKKEKQDFILQYVAGQNVNDDNAAKVIINYFNPNKVISKDFDIQNIESDMLLVAGEIANPRSVGFLANIGMISRLPLNVNEARIDKIIFNGFTVVVVRGTHAGDTVRATNYLIKNFKTFNEISSEIIPSSVTSPSMKIELEPTIKSHSDLGLLGIDVDNLENKSKWQTYGGSELGLYEFADIGGK